MKKTTSIEQFNGPRKAEIDTSDLPWLNWRPYKPETAYRRPGSEDYKQIASKIGDKTIGYME